jgi:hypothetical protein
MMQVLHLPDAPDFSAGMLDSLTSLNRPFWQVDGASIDALEPCVREASWV